MSWSGEGIAPGTPARRIDSHADSQRRGRWRQGVDNQARMEYVSYQRWTPTITHGQATWDCKTLIVGSIPTVASNRNLRGSGREA